MHQGQQSHLDHHFDICPLTDELIGERVGRAGCFTMVSGSFAFDVRLNEFVVCPSRMSSKTPSSSESIMITERSPCPVCGNSFSTTTSLKVLLKNLARQSDHLLPCHKVCYAIVVKVNRSKLCVFSEWAES